MSGFLIFTAVAVGGALAGVGFAHLVVRLQDWWALRCIADHNHQRAHSTVEELSKRAVEIEAQLIRDSLKALERVANDEPLDWDGGRW